MISRLAHSLKDAAASVSSALHQAASSASSGHSVPVNEEIPIGDRTVRVIRLLGEGGFSFVYEVHDIVTGEQFALKRMVTQDPESQTIAEKEIVLIKKLSDMKSPNICRYYGACKREVQQPPGIEFFLLMEFCSYGSFIELVKDNNKKLSERRIAELFTQACVGVSALHSLQPPIAHRDIKLENFILKSPTEVRLCDFGSCTSRAQVYSTREEMAKEEERIGKYSTPMYRAPEMCDLYRRDKISQQVDIWALGTILYCLAFFTHPFQDGGNLQILSAQYFIPESHQYSNYLISLIKRLLQPKPEIRPNIQEVMKMCKMWLEWLNQGNKSNSTLNSTVSAPISADWASFDPPPAASQANSFPQKTPKDEKKKVKKVKKKSETINVTISTSNGSSNSFSSDFAGDFNPDFGSDWNPFPANNAPQAALFPPSPSSVSSTASSTAFTSSGSATQNLFDFSGLGQSLPTRSVSVPPPLHHSHINAHSNSMNNLNKENKNDGANSNPTSSASPNSVFDSFDWALQPAISPSNATAQSGGQFGFNSTSSGHSSTGNRRQRHAGPGTSATPIDLSKLNTSDFKKSSGGANQSGTTFSVPDLKGKLAKPTASPAAPHTQGNNKARIISGDVAGSDEDSDAEEDEASSEAED
jgi:serine/threonine protein kinase